MTVYRENLFVIGAFDRTDEDQFFQKLQQTIDYQLINRE